MDVRRSKPARQPGGRTMGTQNNLKTIRGDIEAWNKHDLERHAKLLDEKHVFESDTIPAPTVGRAAGRQLTAVYLTGFPDLPLEVNQMLAGRVFVVTRWPATATPRCALTAIPPTERNTIR